MASRGTSRERPLTYNLCQSTDSCAGNFTGTQAVCADMCRLMSTVIGNDSDLSDIRLPGSVCLAVGMGDVLTEGNAFSAELALCHI